LVRRPEDLEHIDPKTTVVRIAHTVGENKRIRIVDQAKQKNLRVLNPGIKREAEQAKAEEEQVEVDSEVGNEQPTEAAAKTSSEDNQ
jgi:hypothetical protein